MSKQEIEQRDNEQGGIECDCMICTKRAENSSMMKIDEGLLRSGLSQDSWVNKYGNGLLL